MRAEFRGVLGQTTFTVVLLYSVWDRVLDRFTSLNDSEFIVRVRRVNCDARYDSQAELRPGSYARSKCQTSTGKYFV